jgi:hypothetical protein
MEGLKMKVERALKLLGIQVPEIEDDTYEYSPVGEECNGDGWQCWDTDGGNWYTSRSPKVRKLSLCRRLIIAKPKYWRPKSGEKYFKIDIGENKRGVFCEIEEGSYKHLLRFDIGNCFRTFEQGQEAYKLILQVLRDQQEIVSK